MKFILLTFFVLVFLSGYGYKPKRTNTFSSYKDYTTEVGYSINLSYLHYQSAFAPNLSLHYTHYITNYFGLGLIYSSNYDKNFHNSLNAGIIIRFMPQLVIMVKPGMTVKNVNENYEWMYNFGASVNYEFDLSESIHIGPQLELRYMQDDINYLAGFHMGFSF